MSRRFFAWVCIVLASMSGYAMVAHAQNPTPDPSARMTAPVDGSILFGTANIVGTAANVQFQYYRLDYLSQVEQGAQWQPISRQINQQVTAGILGQWDTSLVKDGPYSIRLRVTLRNGTVLESYIRDLKVQNQQPTALPTQPPTFTALPLPSAGPSATSLVQQPPSSTPRLTPTLPPMSTSAATPPPTILEPPSSGLNGASIQSAMCSGAVLALIGFGILGAYQGMRGRLRRTQ